MGASAQFFALVRRYFKLGIILTLCYFFTIPFLVYAAGPPYQPGETLDPACAPTSTNCTVVAPPTGSGIGTGYLTYWNTSSTVSSTPLLFWDNADSWLGVGTLQPSSTLHVVGITTLQGTTFTNATGSGNLGIGSLSVTNAGIFGTVSSTGITFTNATGTNLTVTTLKDISGNKYATSTNPSTTIPTAYISSLNHLTSTVIATGTASQIVVSTSTGQLVFSISSLYGPSTTIPTVVNTPSTTIPTVYISSLNHLTSGVIATGTANQINVSTATAQLVFSISAGYAPSTTIPTSTAIGYWNSAYASSSWISPLNASTALLMTSSTYWDKAYASSSWISSLNVSTSLLMASSSFWDTAYRWVNGSSSKMDNYYASSTNYDTAFRWVNSSSSKLDSTYYIVNSSNTNWNSAWTIVNASSGNWNVAWTRVNASSSNWDAGYNLRATTTIQALSSVPVWTGLHQFSVAGASTTQFWSSSSTLTNFTFTNATGTNFTVTTLLDVSGNKYVTSTGGGTGNVIVPAASVLAGNIPYFTTNASSTLNPTSTLFFDVATANIGVGTIVPSQKLEVIGNVSSTAICLGGNCQLAWSTTTNWAQNGNNIYNSNTGYVGIGAGLTSPAFPLDVSGTIQVSALVSSTRLTFTNATSTGWLTVANASATNFWFVNATGTNLTVTTLKDISGNAYVTSTPANFTFTNATGTNLTITTLKDVSGNAYTTSTIANFAFTNATGTGNLDIGTITGAGLSDDCSTATSSKLLWNSTTRQFSCGTDTSIPNVVRYSTSTTFSLIVASSTIIEPVSITMTSASNAVLLTMIVEIDSLSATGGEGAITVYRGTSTSSPLVARFSISNNDLLDMRTNSIVVVDQPSTTGVVTYQAWVQYSAASLSALLDRYVTLQEIQIGADLAETYPITDSSISAGDIVAVDTNHPEEVRKTVEAYDRAAIGIVSTKPAMVIGAASTRPGSVALVALAGRVPVRVSGENGPIKPGDYIAPSSIPGVGMKATKFGRTVGIATQSFSGATSTDEGTIIAFVERGYYFEPGTESLSFALVEQGSGNGSAGIGSTLGIYNFDPNVMYSFENLRAQNLEVGSSAKPSGVTIYDIQTKNPYCIIVENGILKAVPGKCGEGVTTNVISAPPATSPVINANTNSTVTVTATTSETVFPPADSTSTVPVPPDSVDNSSTTADAEVPADAETSITEEAVAVDATSTDSAAIPAVSGADTSTAATAITPEEAGVVTSTADTSSSTPASTTTSADASGGGQ